MTREWQIFVYDKNNTFIGEIVDYEQFDAVLRFRSAGSWSIKMPLNSMAQELRQDGARIELALNDQTILSGSWRQDEPSWAEDVDEVVISGLSDLRILWESIVFPSAANFLSFDGKAFSNDAYDVSTGICESVIKHYVMNNLLDSTRLAPLATPVVVAPDHGRGSVVMGRGRFQLVGDLITELAVAGGGYGFDILANVFDIYLPTNKTTSQIFSADMGNLTGYSLKKNIPSATKIIVAGGGEKEERTFSIAQDDAAAAKIGRHIELFVDRRDTTDLAELQETAQQTLLENAEQITVEMQVVDRQNRTFFDDWFVGDTVLIEEIQATVSEAKITLNAEGETIEPKTDAISSISSRSMLAFFDSIRRLNRRVSQIERNY